MIYYEDGIGIRVCAQCGCEDAAEVRDAEVSYCPDCCTIEGGYKVKPVNEKEYK